MIDAIDPQRDAVRPFLGHEFAFERVEPLDHVVQLFEKRGVGDLIGTNASKGLTGKPAAFVAGIEDFEIAAFDFDDQPNFFGKLELVTIVLRSAIDKVADVDWTGLHPRFEVCTAHTNSGIDARSMCAFGPHVAQLGSRGVLNFRNVISRAS